MKKSESFTLKEMIYIIKRKIWILLIITLATVLLASGYIFYVAKPVYDARTSIIFGKTGQKTDDQAQYSNIMLYQNLLKTYSEIVTSNVVAQEASIKIGGLLTPAQIQSKIKVIPKDNTQILLISVSGDNTITTLKLVKAVSESFMEQAKIIYPSGNADILDKAELYYSTSKASNTLILSIALFLGVIISIGTIFLIEYFDSTIKSEKDIKKYLRLNILGTIPKAKQNKILDSLSLDAYRVLKSNIKIISSKKDVKVIMVTSAGFKEGKTVVAANLSMLMAQSGEKTVLIDCHQRKPDVHKFFKLSNDIGLSDIFIDNKKFEDTVLTTLDENLYILTAGKICTNPSKIIESNLFVSFFKELKQYFDHIIIDAPPLLMGADAQILSQYVDGCILVVAARNLETETVIKGFEVLGKSNVNILGVVLNKLDISNKDYHKYYKKTKDKK